MKNNAKQLLYNLPAHRGRNDNLKLLRVITSSDVLKVDFGYYTTDYYTRGGWVRIANNTFIRDNKTKLKYKLLRAENIPIAPNHHHFKTTHEWLYFSLYFEPIPDNTRLIDLIETEQGDETDFNFFNIELTPKNSLEIIIL